MWFSFENLSEKQTNYGEKLQHMLWVLKKSLERWFIAFWLDTFQHAEMSHRNIQETSLLA